MKIKNILFTVLFVTAGGMPSMAEEIRIVTPHNALVIEAERGEAPKTLYYGSREALATTRPLGETARGLYPAYGVNTSGETALSVTHADGSLTTQLVVEGVDSRVEGDALLTVLHLKDTLYPFYVDVCYRAYNTVDMIETWTEITNKEKNTIDLTQYASAYLPVRVGNVWLRHLHGSWANEARLIDEPLAPGMKVITNRDGTRNSHLAHAELMLSLDGKPQEQTGRVIGAALCYSGNYRLRINTDDSDYHHLLMGICEDNSIYHLKKGETFVTPAVALTYSADGAGQVSRNFHKWGRTYRLMHGDKERRILLNSWEGVYFNIEEEGMHQMMDDIAGMGGELFVMDDGWFGGKYQRNSDNAALGDWVTDTRKLPNGIPGLVKAATERGIKFGIWIEPEATNSVSELYEKHPDWIIKSPGREPDYGRGGTQLSLDLANPKVQDFVFSIVDNIMMENPEIAYIKWDMNMGLQNHGSQYLPATEQSHMYIAYHRGFEKVCQRIREKYPDLTIQACASGGARANWGVLPYFNEFWVSDDTDALQRIYMQWGTSMFFPAIAMASHIASSPNHQTFRTIPLKFRIDVAMSGRLGMEIQPKNMTDEEKDLARKAIAEYKEIRPVVQFGELYRLHSPYDKDGLASLMYVSEQKDKAVFYWWKTETFYNQHLPRVPMAGLDPDAMYTVHELNRIDNEPLDCEGKQFSGRYLMEHGLEIPYTNNVDYHKLNAWASRVIYLEK